MPGEPGAARVAPDYTGPGRAEQVGIGCLTAFAGLWSGAMIAVLVAKFVGSFQGCDPGDNGAPCNWQYYALVGGVFGLLSLPALTLRRLRRNRRAAAENPERGEARGTD